MCLARSVSCLCLFICVLSWALASVSLYNYSKWTQNKFYREVVSPLSYQKVHLPRLSASIRCLECTAIKVLPYVNEYTFHLGTVFTPSKRSGLRSFRKKLTWSFSYWRFFLYYLTCYNLQFFHISNLSLLSNLLVVCHLLLRK